jgi:hypothetical protein
LLVGNAPNEFHLYSILSAKTRNIYLAFLIGTFGFVTAQNVLFVDEQSDAEKRNASINAEGISSNPGAVDIRTGTGELAQTVESVLDLPRDTGVFLGGVWVGDTNGLLSGGAEPGKWSFNSLLIFSEATNSACNGSYYSSKVSATRAYEFEANQSRYRTL